MHTKTHHYKALTNWRDSVAGGTKSYEGYSRNFQVEFPGKPTLHASADTAFRGDKSKLNPEEMFLAAVSSCHMLFYLALCSKAGICVVDYEDAAEGVIEMHPDGGGSFSSLLLRPVVTIGPACDAEIAQALHETAHHRCFIARSCSAPIRYIATVKK